MIKKDVWIPVYSMQVFGGFLTRSLGTVKMNGKSTGDLFYVFTEKGCLL
ncbi:MAG: hypothetical protein ACYS67_19050 [Planctomycetota bacterium]|jgi:hypothetical protein